ncbi:hypothetical protein KKF91_03660 [Myxococcota bacterium]|nr:hypothetical protein [Myxococcota bacterium]MBU1429639.1 hypothetical protein [Myxococcota bacterium]MBU1899728.1 hypothetical protein [Myxococcota bacterium]
MPRRPAPLALAVLLCGCHLVLSDPAPFKAKPVAVEDLGVEDLAVRDLFIPPDTLGCVPEEEICDGFDNDCDREIDEAPPGECAPCLTERGVGRCVIGGQICFRGELICARWLPEGGPSAPCDLLDNNCDGRVDEEGEYTPLRTDAEALLVTRCGAGPERWEPSAVEDCDVANPRRVGCQPAHPCYDPDCRARAESARAAGEADCLIICARPDAAEAGDCAVGCRAAVFDEFIAQLSACPRQGGEAATRWSCVNTVTGPACEVVE